MDFDHALSARPTVHPSSAVKNCVLGAYTEIGPGCALEETRLGDYSYCFAQNDIIYSDIGKFCSMATGVRLNPAPHPSSLRPAQHHFTYRCTKYGFGPDDDSVISWRREKRVVIGNDVWLGHNAIIMGGVTIGNGAVVGAGAVVTHDVAPYDVVAGVPARRLRRRFDGETAAALGRIRWWDWPHELLRERIADFRTIEGFCEKYDPLRAGSK